LDAVAAGADGGSGRGVGGSDPMGAAVDIKGTGGPPTVIGGGNGIGASDIIATGAGRAQFDCAKAAGENTTIVVARRTERMMPPLMKPQRRLKRGGANEPV
jgi:hypothetical protein